MSEGHGHPFFKTQTQLDIINVIRILNRISEAFFRKILRNIMRFQGHERKNTKLI
jgi:hypothetical protein